MRLTGILAISVLLNLMLAAAILVLYRHSALQLPYLESARSISTSAAENAETVRTNVVLRRIQFHWSQLESLDYETYIENLREIGCPEETIRDIIVADVNALFRHRRREFLRSQDPQWWRTYPDAEYVARQQEFLRESESRRVQLLNDLLGPGWQINESLAVEEPTFTGPVLGAMSEEAQARVLEAYRNAKQEREDYLRSVAAAGKPADPVRLGEIRLHLRKQLESMMTASQLEEFLLRYSETADRLREDLAGFELSPEEFRELFRRRDQLEMQRPYQAAGGERVESETNLESQFQAIYQSTLSPDRYTALQRYQDPEFRDILDITDALGVSPEAAVSIHQVQVAAAQEAEAIRNDPDRTDDERLLALAKLDEESRSILDEVLGPDLARSFEAHQRLRDAMKDLQPSN